MSKNVFYFFGLGWAIPDQFSFNFHLFNTKQFGREKLLAKMIDSICKSLMFTAIAVPSVQ